MTTQDVKALIGHFIDKTCPLCNSRLLANEVGDEWCSFVKCDYGVSELTNVSL